MSKGQVMFGAIKPQWMASMPALERGSFEKLNQHEEDDDDDGDEQPFLRPYKAHTRSRRYVALLLVVVTLLTSVTIYNAAVGIGKLRKTGRPEAVDNDSVKLPQLPFTPTAVTYDDAADKLHDLTSTDCGATVDEAIARGCAFDVIANLWLPTACYDEEFAMEALNGTLNEDGHGIGAPEFGLTNWRWYEDEEAQRPLHTTRDLMDFLAARDRQGLTLDAYTQMSFHAAHCSYLSRVAVRGTERVKKGERNVWIPEVSTDSGHARHCEHVFGELYRMNSEGDKRNWTEVGFGIAPCVQIG